MKEILTPCILQTIIICCTIISLAMIAVSAFRVWKEKEKEKHDSGTYIFISGSIVFIAITIFSYGFYQSSEILSFISLASSLISIILAVVTIIYSFYTNSNSSNQVEKLNDAADDVRTAANDVKTAAISYNESAESLQENIRKIIKAIDRVEQKADQILYANKAAKRESTETFINFDLDKYIEGFISIASPRGIMAMYACVRANDANKSFNLNIFGDITEMSYCGGFLVAVLSTGLMASYVTFETGVVSVENYIPKVKNVINDWIAKRIDSDKFVKQQKEIIDSYFDDEILNVE